MQAAALSVPVSKAAGAAHGAAAPSLDPTKPDGAASSGGAADAFTQALAGLMGVTAAPAAPTPVTTSNAAPVSDAKPAPAKPTPLFPPSLAVANFPVAGLPGDNQVLATTSPAAPADINVTPSLQGVAAPENTAAPQAAPGPSLPADVADALAALTPTPAPPAPAPSPTPAAVSAQAATTPTLTVQTDIPLAFSAVSFSVTLSGGAAPAAPSVTTLAPDLAVTPPAQIAPTKTAAPLAVSVQTATVQAAPTGQPATPQTPPIQAALAQAVAPLPPSADDDNEMLVATPIAALTLTADETAAALPTSVSAPIKPLVTASTKILVKADAAPATAEAEQAPPADQPATAAPAPASPVVADAGDRNARTASDAPGQTTQTQSAPNSDNAVSLGALAPAPAAPLAAAQSPAALAAANSAAIVNQIASQTAKSVDGRSTRFDISLDPAGLGHVNVKVEIDNQGQVTAQLSFDNAHTAAEAKSQAGQLQQALEQAGFNISQGGLSFDVGSQGGGFAGQDTPAQPPAAAPVQAPDLAASASAMLAATNISRPASGVDITI